MFISPETLVFAVRALIRVGTAARDAYEQHVRDADILLANLPMPAFSTDDALWTFFNAGGPARRKRVTPPAGDLAGYWENAKPKDQAARKALTTAAIQELQTQPGTIEAGTKGNWATLRLNEEYGGTMLLSQWAKDSEPPSPVARIALAFADVALEYIAGNPGILGIGSNGEKLIGALAGNLDQLLPDVDNKMQWNARAGTYYFAERALVIVLHAGLKTIDQNPNLVVAQDRYQKLLGNVLKPLVDRFDAFPNERPSLTSLRDVLVGPMAQAALATLQADPRAFLGGRFDPNAAVGAVTAALLDVAAADGLQRTFTHEGLVKLYQAALSVAAVRPELFIDAGGSKADAARAMLMAVGAAMAKAPPPFTGAGAVDLGVAALQALSANLPRLLKLNPGKPWGQLAGGMLADVLSGFAEGLQQGGSAAALVDLFTPEEAFRLITIFMRQAAATPGMITGDGTNSELRGLVAAFASAIASKGAALLTAEDWIVVAEAVAAEAARNPARLFHLGKAPAEQLLARVLGVVLSRAAIDFEGGGRATGILLFGETLREALALSVRGSAGNAARAAVHIEDLGQLIDLLDKLVTANPGRVGAREWLCLFERHVATVLDAGLPGDLSIEKLLQELGS